MKYSSPKRRRGSSRKWEKFWRLSGETLKWDQRTDLVTSTTRTTLVQGSVDSVGNELVIDINTNEYKLGHNVRTQWRSASSSD